MKTFIVAGVCCLIMGLAPAQVVRKLAIIGSSTSACTGFPGGTSDADCYVNRLVSYYAGLGTTVQVQNLAMHGKVVYEAMPTGYPSIVVAGMTYSPDPSLNITKALNPSGTGSWIPDVILVNFPSNQYNNMNVHDVMSYFRTIKQAGNDVGRQVFVTSTQPRDDYDATGRAKLRELHDSIMIQFGTFAIDFYNGLATVDGGIDPAYARGDYVHLNAAGHAILAQRVEAANIFNAALPVRILSFTAKRTAQEIQINWKAADELSGTIYRVQRSEDGQRFQTIGEVRGFAAAPISTYSFSDRNAGNSTYFYRLEITEPGKTSFSKIEKCNGSSATNILLKSVSASKTSLQLNASQNQSIRIRLINAMGGVVNIYTRNLQPGTNMLELLHPGLSRGVYWIEGFTANEKLFAQAFLAQ